MKNSIFKKVLSFTICLVLMALCVSPAFATTYCDCGNDPVIVVMGFAEVPLYNSNNEQVFAPSTQSILTEVGTLAPEFAKFAFTKDYTAVTTALITAGNNLFEPIKCDTRGDSIYSVKLASEDLSNSAASYDDSSIGQDIVPALADEIGTDHTYYFTYDWRLDPWEIAEQLDAFVLRVQTETNHEKVKLAAMSMGGAITDTYISRYGFSDISNITMISSAFTGLEMVGQIFTGKIEVDGDGLSSLINDYLNTNSEYTALLSYSLLLKTILASANDIIANDAANGNRLYTELIVPVFGQMAGMWELVPESYYEDALVYMFGENPRAGSYSDLVAKLDRYHFIQSNAKTTLNLAQSLGGVTLTLVSNYNTHVAPVTPLKDLTSDGTIETVRTSGGATTAPIGTSFADDYTQAALTDTNYISPDRMIDASTAMFPEQTWFVKNLKHLSFDREGNNCDLFVWLLTSDSQLTVTSNSEYPQFLTYNNNAKRLSCFYTYGDVNYDGKVTLVDARIALRGAQALITLTANQAAPADLDDSGTVNTTDSRNIVKQVAGVA